MRILSLGDNVWRDIESFPVDPIVFVFLIYCYKEIDFVIWEMKKFGVEPFLKVSYHNLQVNYDYSDGSIKYHFKLVPLFLSEDGDTLILCSSQEREAIIIGEIIEQGVQELPYMDQLQMIELVVYLGK